MILNRCMRLVLSHLICGYFSSRHIRSPHITIPLSQSRSSSSVPAAIDRAYNWLIFYVFRTTILNIHYSQPKDHCSTLLSCYAMPTLPAIYPSSQHESWQQSERNSYGTNILSDCFRPPSLHFLPLLLFGSAGCWQCNCGFLITYREHPGLLFAVTVTSASCRLLGVRLKFSMVQKPRYGTQHPTTDNLQSLSTTSSSSSTSTSTSQPPTLPPSKTKFLPCSCSLLLLLFLQL